MVVFVSGFADCESNYREVNKKKRNRGTILYSSFPFSLQPNRGRERAVRVCLLSRVSRELTIREKKKSAVTEQQSNGVAHSLLRALAKSVYCNRHP